MDKVEEVNNKEKKRGGLAIIATLYLLGIFIGALDTGIVTPARTVVQDEFGINDATGVWIITIYTLAYAVAIPIMGKLADRRGRKIVYLIAVFLFGLGSLGCGLSQAAGSFELLLLARVVQAIGGGGILPVATAEFGTAFPEEKRGMALGFVGMAYGVANILGATAGSAIMDIFGNNHWPYVFYINIPICAVIILLGIFYLPNSTSEETQPLDFLGIGLLTLITLGVMYGLKNIDFTDVPDSLASTDVYPYILGALVLLPFFFWREKRASDPVMNLSYFTNRDILLTMIISIVTGIILMGSVFVPQFGENALGMEEGSGGYLVMVLAVFSGIGAPVSGKLIDRFGVKPILGIGLVGSMAGGLYAYYVAADNPTWTNVIICLVLLGFGLGFTMGTPLNYMMLAKTEEREANSALATLSLVRSIGTALGPSVMVAFITVAGSKIPERIAANPSQADTIARMTINEGFGHMFLFVAQISLVALVLLLFYREEKKKIAVDALPAV